MSWLARIAWWAILLGIVILAVRVAVRVAHAAEHLPAEITVYTYDGPHVHLGDLVTFRYGPDSAHIVIAEFGDGIFHAGFEASP